MPKPTPFLWFDTQAEDAARFYTSVFPNSKIGTVARYGSSGPGPAGSVMTVVFELDGQTFTALNAGPHFKFNEAVSFVVPCKSQSEIDHYWSKLTSDGGAESQCGWLKDKYGLSWQIVPTILPELTKDPVTGNRVLQALLTMNKLNIAELQRAADGK
jgi:predicted 3-demethylubiquinone-9 3-methyltransferase (glyoxalase superfamily)